MEYEFRIVDVFTEKPFCGNQLATFLDARGLSVEQMQRLAREFNFAETTFILPADDGVSIRSFRIFTPLSELPFAGHPTLGTACVLAEQKLLGGAPNGSAFLQTKSGAIQVEVKARERAYHAILRLNRAVEVRDEGPSTHDAAAVLSLSRDDVAGVWCASAGLPFCFVHLNDKKAVDAATLDRAAWHTGFSKAWAQHLYFFAGPFRPGSTLYARMFAPALGVDEDPATGSACAALIALLAQQQVESDGSFGIDIKQGVKMGRPSAINVTAIKRDNELAEIVVGGGVVIVGRGTMSL